MKKSILATILLALAFTTNSQAVIYGDIDFPQGALSFADEVHSYTAGSDVGAGWNDPTQALGTPNYTGSGTAVSLGDGGVLIVKFVDNLLTASGTTAADLHIFEVGSRVEWMDIAISTNAIDWISIGSLRGQPTSIDIDAYTGVVFGTGYSYVRIADDASVNQTGAPYGEADIDAVGAIYTVPSGVPDASSTAALLAIAFAGLISLRRRFL